ncbi:MAG: apolipoprotein N-acyltransferase [Saprospiraceae bacterium]
MNKKLDRIIILLCFSITIMIGWFMSQEKLWRHLPLFLFLSFWIGFVLLVDVYILKHQNSKKILVLTAFSSLLLSLGYPPYGLTPLLFIGFVPLFYLENYCNKLKINSTFYIYNAFVLWNIYDTYWVANAALIPGIVAIWLNAFFMLVPWYASMKVGKLIPRLRGVAFICFWICLEYLHLNWEISWPWLNLGNAWSAIPSFIQWYEITGTFGGSLWILLVNVLIYSWIVKDYSFSTSTVWNFIKSKRLYLSYLFLLITLPIVISLIRYNTFIANGKYGEVCLVQPNYEPHYEKFVVPEIDQINRLGRLAEIAINKETKFIVFPETSFGDSGGPIRTDKISSDNRIILLYDFIESHFNIPIVMGVTTINYLAEGSAPTPYTRVNPRTKTAYEIGNSAIILKDRSEKVPLYNKSKLVPGAEIFPYSKFLPFLNPIVDILGGSKEGLVRQKERQVFESKGYVIAPVICYESIYGDYMRDYILKGAQAICIMTNDGWWDDTPGYKQHMAYSKLRAIEFRKPVFRSANTGITCFIDSKGDLTKSIGYGVHSAISQGVSFNDEISFYAKYGDFIAVIALVLAILIVLVSLYSSIFQAKS